MSHSQPHRDHPDQHALEAIFSELASDYHAQGHSPADIAQADAKLRALLAHLDTDVSPPEGLTDLVILRTAQSTPPAERTRLSPLECDAVDAMMACGFEPQRVPRELRACAHAFGAAGEAITQGGPQAPADLVDRTMSRIEAFGEIPESLPMRVPMSRRFADLVSIAAMLLIVVSIGWPALAAWRSASLQATCSANMRSVASAFGQYGGDYREHLPAATAGFGGGQTWWNVGKGAEQSNSANLYTLTRAGYAPLSDLACPGNEHALTEPAHEDARDWDSLDQVSYSYRIISRKDAPRLGVDQRFVIAADRSPVVLRAARGEPIFPKENSPNHRGKGQMVLFSDGSVLWTASPKLDSGDNIYLPRAIELMVEVAERLGRMEPISGTELPARHGDDFVGP